MIAKLRQVFTTMGALEGTLYLCARALAAASGGRMRLVRYAIVAQPVPPAGFAPYCRPSPATEVRVVPVGDALVQAFPRPPQVIAWRYAQGHACWGITARGTFAGFLWLARGAYLEDEVRVRYVLTDAERCAWDFDVHVEPAYRLGRSFARLWEAAHQSLAAEGVQWTLSRISTFNPDSLRSHARLGVRRLMTVTFLCAGRVQIALLPVAPFVHLGWREAHVPHLPLPAPRGAAPSAP
jgi:hypothetical protein